MTELVVLTVDQLEGIVSRAIRAGLDAQQPAEVMTREDVARLLKVDEKTVNVYVERDGLPGKKLGPRDWRFFRSDVIAWMNRRNAR